ncbi:MAG: ThiF family adenylyltransferase, partial [Muribaculaceae bacterium]|nr:ThiF family adenylyltransferase [Muribaculaceae bacterium]
AMITRDLAKNIFATHDFIIDATDNPSSKAMTDEICYDLSIPCCIGGVAGFKGQVMSWKPECARYSDIFNPRSTDAGFTPCSLGGVLGPAAGVVACIQASEAIKHLAGTGKMLYNKIFIIDLLTMESTTLEVG